MTPSSLNSLIYSLENNISNLERYVDFLEMLVWIASAAVVIGVAFELLVVVHEYKSDLRGWRRGSICSPEKPSRSMFAFELLGALLVTLGVAGELWVGIVSGNRNSELRDKNRTLVGLIRQQAGNAERVGGEASERAARLEDRARSAERLQREAESRIAIAEQLTAEASLETARLRKSMMARRLTGEQRSALRSLLRHQPLSVTIVSKFMDSESTDFADDIEGALKDAGWNAYRIKNHVGRSTGVQMGTVQPRDTGAHDLIRRFSDALRSVGIDNAITDFKDGDSTISPPFQAHILYLVVGDSPAIKEIRDGR